MSVDVRALVLYPPGRAPGQRFRIEQWAGVLAEQGIQVQISSFADPALAGVLYVPGRLGAKVWGIARGFARRLKDLVAAADVVLVYRAAALVGPAILERLLAARRPVVYDFDDAIFLPHTSAANLHLRWLKWASKTDVVCRLSREVTVGNDYLASYARQHNPNVTVIPSSVDTDRYAPAPNGDKDRVVGWMGSTTSQVHLEAFAPVLREIRARSGAVIRVVSDRRPLLAGLEFEWRPWTAEREVAELNGFGVGIMPLPDDPWSRGKCAMKALLYMAVGVPAVCSDVGANREVVRHGENGFLATAAAEWVERVGTLLDDRVLRERLGQAARRTVVTGYSKQVCGSRFAAVIRKAARS